MMCRREVPDVTGKARSAQPIAFSIGCAVPSARCPQVPFKAFQDMQSPPLLHHAGACGEVLPPALMTNGSFHNRLPPMGRRRVACIARGSTIIDS